MNSTAFGTNVETLFVVFALVALSLVACVIVGRCIQNFRFLHAYRRDIAQRFNALRIRKMLEMLGISRRRYLGKALSVDVEKHLQRCRNCANPDTCDEALSKGDLSKTEEFCPNFSELLSYRPKRLGSTRTSGKEL